ncbi:MAG: hypothetical protein IPM64_04175 [Phycisphaerales bacterium]|nr:hypothetical protein [Phycisphaerales bacterium]
MKKKGGDLSCGAVAKPVIAGDEGVLPYLRELHGERLDDTSTWLLAWAFGELADEQSRTWLERLRDDESRPALRPIALSALEILNQAASR